MSSFKLRNRPKKPQAPNYVSFDVGNEVSISELSECVEEFKAQNPDRVPTDMYIEADDSEDGGSIICLVFPPSSLVDFESKLEEYKYNLAEYKEWQKKNKKKIEQAKAEKAALVKKRKLERTQERLNKELAEVEVKLEKS